MNGTVPMANALEDRTLGFAILSWICHPASTDAKQLTVVEGSVAPGQGHGFHRHPDQEEVTTSSPERSSSGSTGKCGCSGPATRPSCRRERCMPSFHAGDGDSRLLAIFGPSVGDAGIETIEMSGEAPWSTLRPIAVPA